MVLSEKDIFPYLKRVYIAKDGSEHLTVQGLHDANNEWMTFKQIAKFQKPFANLSLYIGKDGRDYESYEDLRMANEWVELGGTGLAPLIVARNVRQRMETIALLAELDRIEGESRRKREVNVAIRNNWTNTQWMRFRLTGQTHQ